MSVLGLAKTHLDRSVVAAGFLVTILWVVTLHLVDNYDGRHPEPLSALAWRGQPVAFTLDNPACESMNLGELVCGRTYFGKFDAATNTWRVKGPTSNASLESTASFNNAPHRRGAVSIFGIVATFDDEGRLKRLNKDLGTVSLPIGNWVVPFD